MRGLRLLLLFIPVSILSEILQWSPLLTFAASALAVIPLAGIMSEATEALAEKIGPRFGGLLNATLGNAAELIITLFAVRAGLLDLVKASLIGSILGNVLLVAGASILAGGLKNGVQKFSRGHAGLDSTLTILAVIALSIPSLFNAAIEPDAARVEALSLTTAGAMLLIYVLSIVFTIRSRTPREAATDISIQPSHTAPRWTPRQSIGILIGATIGLALMSEFLVSAVEPVSQALGFSEFFIGIILVPIIGNVAEHIVAVQVAIKNQMDLSLSIAMSSSLQIALFVAPVLVFVSLLMGHPLTLEFNSFEMISLFAASLISALVSLDGESNWLEGAMLLAVYAIVALAFFFLPAV
jgi:Ca2+:H+ antiporter